MLAGQFGKRITRAMDRGRDFSNVWFPAVRTLERRSDQLHHTEWKAAERGLLVRGNLVKIFTQRPAIYSQQQT
jgi:hypothetical protein